MIAALRYDRPDSSEYAPFYAGYISRVPDRDLLDTLEAQLAELTEVLGGISEERGNFAYAPGKWTIKEVVSHVIDAERVFSYRALRIGRADETPLPGFDEQAWTPHSGANDRTLADLIEELQAVRTATLALLRHLPAIATERRGTASGREVSVRALAWIIAGHSFHHLGVLRERYLV